MQKNADASTFPSPRTRLLLGLVILFITSSAGVYILFCRRVSNDSLEFELAKTFMQIGLVSIAGAVLSFLTFDYERDRALADKKNDEAKIKANYTEALVRNTLTSLMVHYSKVKKARRLLRALGLSEHGRDTRIKMAPCDCYLEWIIDAQLAIENMVRDVDASKSAFSTHATLRLAMERMEKYLSGMISEYERERKTVKNGLARATHFPKLRAFLAPASKTSAFRLEFIVPAKAAQNSLRRQLLAAEPLRAIRRHKWRSHASAKQ